MRGRRQTQLHSASVAGQLATEATRLCRRLLAMPLERRQCARSGQLPYGVLQCYHGRPLFCQCRASAARFKGAPLRCAAFHVGCADGPAGHP